MRSLRKFAYAAAVLSAAFAGVANSYAQTVKSQPYTFKSVTVRAGGYVPGIEFSPAQKNLAYCRTDIGGPYKWDDSQKKWVALIDFTDQYNYYGCESIAPDPVDPNKLYIACGMYTSGPAAIFRSSDGGKTFDVVPLEGVTMGGNSNGRGMGERLAVDPNSTNILYFGSRSNGLLTSTDSGKTWNQVASFPVKGGGGGGGGGANGGGGLGFVIFDPASGSAGHPSQNIYVANSEDGFTGLYRSTDAGKTWQSVPGQPPESLFPNHAQIDTTGVIYFSYANVIGPNGGMDGGIWKFNTKDGKWTDITPEKPGTNGITFGYASVAVDHKHPGTVMASTMSRDTKTGGEDVLRSTDGGKTWKSLTRSFYTRDFSNSPYVETVANPNQHFGWWFSALAIDPFDSDHACFATGATIYNTGDITRLDSNEMTHWNLWTTGIEETAILYLVSPTDGPHLMSGFGDIGGFIHDDVDQTPAAQYLNPKFANGAAIEYAGINPSFMVRNGTGSGAGATGFAFSYDYGHHWEPLPEPPVAPVVPTTQGAAPGGRRGGRGGGGGRGAAGFGEGTPSLIISADGKTIMLLGATAQITRNFGANWTPVKGLAPNSRVLADRINPQEFYAIDQAGKQVFTSTDGGATFTASASTGLPDAPAGGGGRRGGGGGGGGALHYYATFGREGDLWAVGLRNMLHSADGGKTFTQITNAPTVASAGRDFGLGKAADGKDYPAIYVAGVYNNVTGIFRSDDLGTNWVRINDDDHRYGNNPTELCGDPRIYGRVYFGTNGRGILYGDIAK
jgi:hypothetical protein